MKSREGSDSLRPTSVAKRRAVLEAAERAFLDAGYDSVTMDDIARDSGVAKQTVYAHFTSKEALFVELVSSMTRGAGDQVHLEPLPVRDSRDVGPALEHVLLRQLDVVLAPRLLQLRRLVIGEVARFPSLAAALARNGPHRAIDLLTDQLTDLAARGLLEVSDPRAAASQLNWLVMGEPVNDAMLLGDDAVPPRAHRRAHVHDAVATFLAAYGVDPPAGQAARS